MATRALDIVTIMRALDVLTGKLGIQEWFPKNDEQALVIDLANQYKELLGKITGLDALASNFYQELNDFLTEHGFNIRVDMFDPAEGIGVVSILDKLVKWRNGPGELVSIYTNEKILPGFELPANGVRIFRIEGYPNSHLLKLLTKSDDILWLFVHDNPNLNEFAMVKLSMEVMWRPCYYNHGFSGARVPMLDFDVQPDLSWLLKTGAITTSGDDYFISQAKQQFKMRMDETGARVKVATANSIMKSTSVEPEIFIVDRPFYGWWTQKGIDLPMAAFFADWDSLHKPSGSPEQL